MNKSQNQIIENIIEQYKSNPYGVHCSSVVVDQYIVYFANQSDFYRQQCRIKLRQLGIKNKNIKSFMKDKGYSYRYCLRVLRNIQG